CPRWLDTLPREPRHRPLRRSCVCAIMVSLEITPSRFVKRWRRGPEPRAIVYADGSAEEIDPRALIERPERVIKLVLALSYLMQVLLYAVVAC
ncbi:MAG: hypothetical protein ACP5ID_06220, partial [Conexivisphaera sp.]